MTPYTVHVLLLLLALFVFQSCSGSSETCFLKDERDAGMNRICLYSCVSGDAAITIKYTQLCPLSIKR